MVEFNLVGSATGLIFNLLVSTSTYESRDAVASKNFHLVFCACFSEETEEGPAAKIITDGLGKSLFPLPLLW